MPSEFDAPPAGVPLEDRRTRKRAARREALLDQAAAIIDARGLDALTMSALAEAADYAPASLYTYFRSRSALVAALQQRALAVLARVGEQHVEAWDAALVHAGAPGRDAALARLVAFSELFLAAPAHHPREFGLQQRLLVTPGIEEAADAAEVVPAAMAVLSVPARLLRAAVDVGALAPEPETTGPLGEPVDGDLVRTLAWVVALNGALLTDGLATGLPTTGVGLGRSLTASLLEGWGAAADELRSAERLAAGLPVASAAGGPGVAGAGPASTAERSR